MECRSYRALPGVHASPNIQGDPALYELENRAADPDGLIEAAMQQIAPWDGRVVLDLGAGTGFHVPRFHATAEHVFAVEPHDPSRFAIMQRAVQLGLTNLSVLKGSAEYIPLQNQSVDICHARFAYFFAPHCELGLHELARVMRPGGTAFIIDNHLSAGTFARWLQRAGSVKPEDAATTATFWADHGFATTTVVSEWRFQRREDFEAVVQLEFGATVGPELLAHHNGLCVEYHMQVYHRMYGADHE